MEELTLEEAIQLFILIITQDLVHQDYQHTVDKAKLYKKLVTGEDMDDLYDQYAPKEDTVTFLHKKKISRQITPAVISSLTKPFYKVPRTDRLVKKVVTVVDQADVSEGNDPADKVLDKMRTFYGSENNVNGLDYFMQQRFIELQVTDPNTWIVTEFTNSDNGEVFPYPYEVCSEKARNFGISNNVLMWFVARDDLKFLEPNNLTATEQRKYKQLNKVDPPSHIETDGHKWSMYIKDNTIVFEQVGSDSVLPTEEEDNYDPNRTVMKLNNGNTYIVEIFPHLTGVVPAKRVGYKRDLTTDGRTFVSFYDDAMCYLLDSIKTVAEFTLTKSDHVFPKMLQYVPPCGGESETNTCFNGRAALGGICRVCHGSGKMPIHTSAQDIITIKIPDNPADMVDLNKLIAYFSPPIELVKFQNELVKQVKVDCHQTVFNSTVLLKDNTGQAATTETATSKNFDMDSINDTLAPYGEAYSSFWIFEGDIIARLLEVFDKVQLIHRFPSDFKMKTIGDLYSEMKTANDSNAPVFLIEMLNDDIASTKFQDDPDLLLMYEVKKKLNPFRGKSDNDIQNALNTDYTPLWKKVLYVNFEDILTQAEIENEEFYLDDYQKQVDIIRAITDIMIEEINATKVTPTLKPIAGPDATAIYAEGDTVTIEPGNEQDPSHAGINFIVKSVTPSGDSFSYSLANEDGSITATYDEADLN